MIVNFQGMILKAIEKFICKEKLRAEYYGLIWFSLFTALFCAVLSFQMCIIGSEANATSLVIEFSFLRWVVFSSWLKNTSKGQFISSPEVCTYSNSFQPSTLAFFMGSVFSCWQELSIRSSPFSNSYRNWFYSQLKIIKYSHASNNKPSEGSDGEMDFVPVSFSMGIACAACVYLPIYNAIVAKRFLTKHDSRTKSDSMTSKKDTFSDEF